MGNHRASSVLTRAKAPRDVIKLVNELPLKRIVKVVLVALALLFVVSAVIAGIISGIEKSAHTSPPTAKVTNVAAVKPLATPTVTHTQVVHEPAAVTVKPVTVTKPGPTVTKTVSTHGTSTACQLTVTLAEDENKQFAIFAANYGGVKNVMDAAIYAIGTTNQALINTSLSQMNSISIASNDAVVKITNDQLQMDIAVTDCKEGR